MFQDQGGLNSTTVVIINVKDVQDTAPFFTSLPYMVSLPEDSTVGSSVLQVTALDGDRGVPNPINYRFISGNENVWLSHFEAPLAADSVLRSRGFLLMQL